MPYRRGYQQSRKHENTWTSLNQNASTTQEIILAKGTEAGAITDATATEVKSGARIKWIYLEFHFSAESIASAKVIHWLVAFQPFSTGIGNANAYQQIQRRFILKRGMEMLPRELGTVYKRIFTVKIPSKFQRLGIADEFVFKYQCSSTEGINACGIAIYRPSND